MDRERLRDELASLLHERWQCGATELVQQGQVTEETMNKWERDCFRPFFLLSQEDKQDAYYWADKVLEIVERRADDGDLPQAVVRY